MSTEIDQRVVSMQFDNKNFERNVQTSLSTIDKLKRSLNFGGASKSLGSLGASVKKVNMSPLSSAVDTVRLKFSALEVMAVTALANITNSAVNAGKRLVSAFTIDPIKSGFQEYETQINAIQTILANTESKGTTLDDVNKALDTLNKYADKTIYNFTEMTRNIGTFTAAGIDLDTSVNAIQGIANLAAVSGSNSQQASTAMYQLSQALASGTVKLMDWNSVVNAGMGGQVFQDALKETARVHGIKIDEMIKKQGSFRETLSEGWLTSEVLTETLMKFTLTTEGLTDAQIEQNRAMLKAKGYSDEQIDAIFKLGQTATDAATKVKTFTQLMDTLKEAAQSGWTKTWELIVGDFDDAKNLWTMVSDTFGEMIGNSADRRNNFLSKVLSGSTWDDLVKGVNEAGIETKDFESAISKTLTENGINVDKLVQKYGSLEEAFKKGAVSSKYLKEALKGLNGGVKESLDFSGAEEYIKKRGKMQFRTRNEAVNEVEKALKKLGYNFVGSDGVDYGEDGFYGQLTEKTVKDFQKKNGLKVTGIVDDATLKKLKEATSITKELDSAILDLVDGVTNLGGREVLIEGLCNVFKGLMSFITPIKEAFWNIFSISPENLYKMIEGFRDLTAKFKLSDDNAKKLKTAFEGLFSVIGIGWDFIKVLGGGLWNIAKKVLPVLGNGFLDISSNIGEWLKNLRKTIAENKVFENLISGASDLVGKAADKIKEWYGQLKAFFEKPEVQKWLEDFKAKLGTTASAILDKLNQVGKRVAEFFSQIKNGDFSSIKEALSAFKTNVIDFLFSADTAKIFDGIVDSIKKFKDAVKKHLVSIGINLSDFGANLSNFISSIKNFVSGNAGGLIALGILLSMFLIFKKIAKVIELVFGPLSAFGDLAEVLGKGIKKLSKALSYKLKTEAVKNIAISIGILAASLFALSKIGPSELWSAVGALTAVIAAFGGLIFATSKLDDKIGDLAKLSGSVLMLSGALLAFTIAAKNVAGLDDVAILKTGLVLVGFLVFVKMLGKVTKNSSVDLASFGSMMLSLSGALILLGIAVGILGNMRAETLIKGTLAVGAFLLMMAGMMKATRHLEKDTPRFAASMAGLSAALLLLSISAGILGKMKFGTLVKGVGSVGIFLLMMVGVMKAANKLSKDIPKFGTTMLGLSFGLLAMATTVKIIAGIAGKDLIKGGLVITAFLGLMALMMAATRLLTKNSKYATQVGVMMLSFAGAMIILTGAIAILAMINPSDLAKARTVITVIGGIFAGLMYMSKYVKGGKGIKSTLITMSVSIGILAVSLAALSFIDPSKLTAAAGALSIVMGMFALMTASTKFIGAKSIGTLIALTGIVAILSGIIYLLSGIPADGALKVAGALSALILSLSASCAILAVVGNTGPAAFIGIGVLAALMGVIGAFAAIAIASLPKIGTQLSSFMSNLSGFIDGATRITPEVGKGIKNLAEAILILTSASLLDGITSFFGFGSLSVFGTQVSSFGTSLANFLTSISTATSGIAGKDGEVSSINWDNIDKAVGVAFKLVEIARSIPDTSGLSTVFAKKDLGVFGDQVASFATGLGTYLASVSGKFTKLNDAGEVEEVTANWDNIDKATGVANKLATLASKIPDTSGWSTVFAKKDIGAFGDQIAAFAAGLGTYLASVSGKFTKLNDAGEVEEVTANWDNIDKATGTADKLATLANKIPDTSGWETAFAKKDLGIFGDQVASFAISLGTYLASVSGKFTKLNDAGEVEEVTANWTNIDKATGTADKLATLASKIPDTSGWATAFAKKDIGVFGTQVATFATSLGTYLVSVSGKFTKLNEAGEVEEVTANWTNIEKATDTASDLADVAVKIPDTSGWATDFAKKDIGAFGTQVAAFAASLGTYLASVSGKFTKLNEAGEVETVTVNWDNIGKATDIAVRLSEIAATIPDTSGWSTIFGQKDIGAFGTQVSTFATGINSFVTSISNAFPKGSTDNVDFTVINSVVDVANRLAGMAKTVGENSAGWEWLTGKDGLDAFGTKIETLGTKLASFCETLSGDDFDITSITSAITEINKFARIAERLGGKNVGDLSAFGYQISSLGSQLSIFYSDIESINGYKFSSIATGLEKLASINVSNADAIQSFITSLGEVSADGVEKFATEFENADKKVLSAISTMMQAASTAITTEGTVVKSAAISVALSASKAAKHWLAYTQAYNAGVYVVQGFSKGITASTFMATAAAVAMAQAALNAARALLKINSPSKVFMKVGQSVPEGFSMGIDKLGGMVVGSTTAMAENALNGTRKAIARISDIVNSDIDSQPTIRPVMDLTDVEYGANAIDSLLSMNPSVGAIAKVQGISASMNNRQNGSNGDVISAIKDLGSKLGNMSGNTYNVNGVTYDDGSNISDAVKTLIRAARVERRI